MGVTVHFEGYLRGAPELATLVRHAAAFAAKRAWPTRKIDNPLVTLLRTLNEQEVHYVGPVSGIEVQPHPSAEPLRLEFDRELFIQQYCKTQFAGADIHVEIIELLRQIAPLFVTLQVVDEGDYWQRSDRAALHAHIDNVERVLEDIRHSNPHARGPIWLESGRIVDLVEGRPGVNAPPTPPKSSILRRIRSKLFGT